MGDSTSQPTPSASFEMPEHQWEYLLGRLNSEETVLFVGPDVFYYPEFGTVENALHDYLQRTSKDSGVGFIKKFYRDDKFFALNDQDEYESLWYFMKTYKDFFSQHEEQLSAAKTTARKLAEIPFSTIISLSPNKILEEAYGDDLPVHSDFYNKNKPPKKYVPGSKEDPLVYYMRGKMDEDESMIISHNDLFDYLESTYRQKSMDADFKDLLKRAKYFVFLGLPFESWYMQLLIRLFNFHVVNPRIVALKRFSEQHSNKKVLYEDLYDVKFYDSDSREFIEQLHERCAAAGVLRSTDGDAANAAFLRDAQMLLDALKEARHQDSIMAIEILAEKYLPDRAAHSDFYDTLDLGIGNYNSSYRKHLLKKISKEDMGIAEVTLREFLKAQFDELKSLIDEQ